MLDSSSPLEALALNYASFGVFTLVNNLWTWVAVLTAAISFWASRKGARREEDCTMREARGRINSTSFSEKPNHHQPHIDRNTSGSRAQPSANTYVEPQAPSPSSSQAPAQIPALLSVCDAKDVDGITEGTKYTVYYYEEEEERESGGGDRDGEVTVVKEWRDDDDDNGVNCGEWWERVTMRGKIGDLGWRSHQDLTVINGNVVRLWDDCRRRSEKRRCYCSCCAVWSLVN